jgi:2-aminoethylphosphonate transport system permease protein
MRTPCLSASDAAAITVTRASTWRWGASLNLAAVTLLVLLPLIFYPLLRLLLLSVTGDHGLSLDGFTSFFGGGTVWSVFGTTMLIVLCSAGLASLLGIVLAGLLFFFPVPGTGILVRFLELFVAFPSFLVAFSMIFLYGSQGAISLALMHVFGLAHPPLNFLFGFGGVVLAEVMFYTPFVVRPTMASLSLLDRRLMEAASSLGAPPAMVLRRIVLPLALPGIAAGVILCTLLTLNEFGIPLVLGSVKLVTLPVAIYSAATVDLNLHAAAAMAVIMLAISLCLYGLYRHLAGRQLRLAR